LLARLNYTKRSIQDLYAVLIAKNLLILRLKGRMVCMGVWSRLNINFDVEPGEFELLERESGQPRLLGVSDDIPNTSKPQKKPVDASIEINIDRIYSEFRKDINPDLIIRRFMLGGLVPAAAAFINGMADGNNINDFILRSGMRKGVLEGAQGSLTKFAIENIFAVNEANTETDWNKVMEAITEGQTAVFIDKDASAIIVDTRGFEKRSIGVSENEKTVLGPKEAFSESIRTNITLLRRIVKRTDFVCEFRGSGSESSTRIGILYCEGIVNETLLNEIKRRLSSVDTRAILDVGVLDQLASRKNLSPFPQTLITERPDRAASHIMQGHVAVLLDGSPAAVIMPVTLFSLMTSSEDAYLKPLLGSILRVVRYFGAITSLLLPGIFIAMALYHQDMLSTEVLTTLMSSRKFVNVSLEAEMIFLLLVFHLIREAGIRVPGSIGQAIGIIGGLILGQAAVAANLASSVILILVALTGLGNFCIPDYSLSLCATYTRLAIVFAGWLGGLLGVSVTALLIIAYMASIKSYGVPFLSPYAPKTHSRRPVILRGVIKMRQRAEDYANTKGDSKL
jgi:spore germination protein KA